LVGLCYNFLDFKFVKSYYFSVLEIEDLIISIKVFNLLQQIAYYRMTVLYKYIQQFSIVLKIVILIKLDLYLFDDVFVIFYFIGACVFTVFLGTGKDLADIILTKDFGVTDEFLAVETGHLTVVKGVSMLIKL